MEPLIKPDLKESLVLQFAHEVLNSHIYLYIANFLHGKGLDNIAKKFEVQWKEEQEHSQIIYSLITDLGETFEMPEIDGCNFVFNSIKDVAQAYLDREIQTTNSLNDIKVQAMSEDDPNPVVEERMRKMIKLQQAEYEEATSFWDKSQLFSEWWQVALWDSSLGE